MVGKIRNWTPKTLAPQNGKVFVITGANSGIGLEAAKILAGLGGSITMLCRNPDKAGKAVEEVSALAVGDAAVSTITMDLGDMASVRTAAAEVAARTPAIDALINNAGLMMPPRRTLTTDGFELQMGVNHFGHFLLAGLLADEVEAAKGRFVIVSSAAHKFGLRRIRFEDMHFETGFNPMTSYAQSKLANAMFGVELDRRLQAAGRTSRAVICHPGYSSTNLQSTAPEGLLAAVSVPLNFVMAQSAQRGSWPTVLSAVEPEAEGSAYYGPTWFANMRGPVGNCRLARPARDTDAARQLWEVSEAATGHTWSL